jgi:hypothetical protein
MHLSRRSTRFSLIAAQLFCCGAFFYFFLRINPSLHYIMQEPAFRANERFLSQHLSYPGGIADYGAAFLMQFFQYPMIGSLLIAIVFLAIALASWRMFRPARWYQLHLFPVAFCAILQSNYYHHLSATIGLLFALLAFNIYQALCNTRKAVRVGIFLIIGTVLYFCAGGNFLLFALLCMLSETLCSRQYVLAFLYGIFAAALPWCAQRFFFLVSMHDAYLYALPFGVTGYVPFFTPYVLYVFFPVVYCSILLIHHSTKAEKTHGKFHARLAIAGPAVTAAALIIVCVLGLIVSFNRTNNATLLACQMSRLGKWGKLILYVKKTSTYNLYTACAAGQAFYYTRTLPVDLFTIPQFYGANGLFLFFDPQAREKTYDPLMAHYRCDLYFRLGLVNNAEQWGYEAIGVRGESGWTLRRLAQIHALKGELAAARTCLSVLESMPLERAWAEDFRTRLDNGALLLKDATLLPVRAAMPMRDFIAQNLELPMLDVERLLEQNPNNDMAYEYLMAAYMLSGNLQRIVSLIAGRSASVYTEIPRLYQEALLLHQTIYPGADTLALKNHVNTATISDFSDFNAIMENYRTDPGMKVKKLTERFWNSYWYYYLFSLQERQGKR